MLEMTEKRGDRLCLFSHLASMSSQLKSCFKLKKISQRKTAMEPLSAIAITSLAFIATKISEKALDKTLDAAWDKAKATLLRNKIWNKLSGDEYAEAELDKAEAGDETAVENVADCLKVAMKRDPEFAEEVQQLAQQIVSIGKVQGEIFNVFGGEVNVVKDNKSPVIQGGEGHQITFNINSTSE